jgi:hypothetical protein
MSTATERFEAIGDLYYRRYGRLRPGKSEAFETGRDASSLENCTQFDQWFATSAFTDAINRIIELENKLQQIEDDSPL